MKPDADAAMRARWTAELVEERGEAWVERHRGLLAAQWRWIVYGDDFPDPVDRP